MKKAILFVSGAIINLLAFSQETVKNGYTQCYEYTILASDNKFNVKDSALSAKCFYNSDGKKTFEYDKLAIGNKKSWWTYDSTGHEIFYKRVEHSGSWYYGYPGEKYSETHDSSIVIKKYDQNHNLCSRTAYDAKGLVISDSSWAYNNDNKLLEWTCFTNDKKIFKKEIFDYNSSGKKIFYKFINENYSHYSKYFYNKYGNIYLDKRYNSKGVLTQRHKRFYNNLQKPTKDVTYNPFGLKTWKITYGYNKNDSLSEIIAYSGLFGKIVYKTVFQYDDFGNKLSKITYNEKNNVSNKYEYSIDSLGNKTTKYTSYLNDKLSTEITKTVNPAGKKIRHIIVDYWYSYKNRNYEWKYNDNNQLVEEILWTDDMKIYFRYVYSYDEFGNIATLDHYTEGNVPYKRKIYIYSF